MRRKPNDGSSAQAEAERIERRERLLDQALADTFPASDPPASLAPHSPRE